MDPERKKKRKSRFFPGLLFGVILGWLAASFTPTSWQGFVPDALRPGGLVQGDVLEKSKEADRLLLKLTTDNGMILATFTERQEEIDLLVERGATVTIRVPRYEPFLADPPIERVERPTPAPTPPPTPAPNETVPESSAPPAEPIPGSVTEPTSEGDAPYPEGEPPPATTTADVPER